MTDRLTPEREARLRAIEGAGIHARERRELFAEIDALREEAYAKETLLSHTRDRRDDHRARAERAESCLAAERERADRAEAQVAALRTLLSEAPSEHEAGCSGEHPEHRCKCGVREWLPARDVALSDTATAAKAHDERVRAAARREAFGEAVAELAQWADTYQGHSRELVLEAGDRVFLVASRSALAEAEKEPKP